MITQMICENLRNLWMKDVVFLLSGISVAGQDEKSRFGTSGTSEVACKKKRIISGNPGSPGSQREPGDDE